MVRSSAVAWSNLLVSSEANRTNSSRTPPALRPAALTELSLSSATALTAAKRARRARPGVCAGSSQYADGAPGPVLSEVGAVQPGNRHVGVMGVSLSGNAT